MYYIFLQRIRHEINSSKLLFTFITFVGLTGIATGIFTGFRLDEWLKELISANILNIISNSDKININLLPVLLYAISNDALFFVAMLSSSFNSFAIPVGICAFLIRGFYLGFAFAIIFISCGWFLIAETLVFLPLFFAFVLLGARCIKMSVSRLSQPVQREKFSAYFKKHLRCIMPFIMFTIFMNLVNVILVYLTIKVFY